MEKKTKDSESNITFWSVVRSIIVSASASLVSALISKYLASDKDDNIPLAVFFISFISLSVITFSITFTWVKIDKKLNKIDSKGGRNVNILGDGNKFRR